MSKIKVVELLDTRRAIADFKNILTAVEAGVCSSVELHDEFMRACNAAIPEVTVGEGSFTGLKKLLEDYDWLLREMINSAELELPF